MTAFPPPQIVTLAEAKDWMRVDGADEDALIQRLIDAATEAVCDHAEHMIYLGEVPARLKLAVLTYVASAFGNREDGADMPASAARLLNPMRRLDI